MSIKASKGLLNIKDKNGDYIEMVIGGGGNGLNGDVAVDTSLSSTSTNPVQNKVITNEIMQNKETIRALNDKVDILETGKHIKNYTEDQGIQADGTILHNKLLILSDKITVTPNTSVRYISHYPSNTYVVVEYNANGDVVDYWTVRPGNTERTFTTSSTTVSLRATFLQDYKADDGIVVNGEYIYKPTYIDVDGIADIDKLNMKVDGTDKYVLENARHIKQKEDKNLTILHLSDVHGDEKALNRIVEDAEKLSGNVDEIICTGDVVEFRGEPIDSWWNPKVLICVGNHDSASVNDTYNWTAVTMADRDRYYISPFKSQWGNVNHENGKSYYYKDYVKQKVRLIVIDVMLYSMYESNTSLGNAQNTWLGNLLDGAITNGYHVVIAEHAPHEGSKPVECEFTKYRETDMPLENDCHLPDSVVNLVASKITNGLHFVGYLCGHMHQDNIWDVKGDGTQLMYCVTCANTNYPLQWEYSDQYRDTNHDAYNLVTIDTTNSIIKIVRGGGANVDVLMRDRKKLCIDYAHGKVIDHNYSVLDTLSTLETDVNNLKTYVTPEMFGAVGNGSVDDSNALNRTYQYAKENNVSVVLAKKYLIASTIYINTRTHTILHGNPIIISTVSNGATLEIDGDYNVGSDGGHNRVLSFEQKPLFSGSKLIISYHQFSHPENENTIAVRLIGVNSCSINNLSIVGFGIGIHVYGNHNYIDKFDNVIIQRCNTGIKFQLGEDCGERINISNSVVSHCCIGLRVVDDIGEITATNIDNCSFDFNQCEVSHESYSNTLYTFDGCHIEGTGYYDSSFPKKESETYGYMVHASNNGFRKYSLVNTFIHVHEWQHNTNNAVLIYDASAVVEIRGCSGSMYVSSHERYREVKITNGYCKNGILIQEDAFMLGSPYFPNSLAPDTWQDFEDGMVKFTYNPDGSPMTNNLKLPIRSGMYHGYKMFADGSVNAYLQPTGNVLYNTNGNVLIVKTTNNMDCSFIRLLLSETFGYCKIAFYSF